VFGEWLVWLRCGFVLFGDWGFCLGGEYYDFVVLVWMFGGFYCWCWVCVVCVFRGCRGWGVRSGVMILMWLADCAGGGWSV